ncbi:hypothetical protein V7P28_10665, partial [Klebsiella michiganensis]
FSYWNRRLPFINGGKTAVAIGTLLKREHLLCKAAAYNLIKNVKIQESVYSQILFNLLTF